LAQRTAGRPIGGRRLAEGDVTMEFDRPTVERLQELVGRTINSTEYPRTHADIIVALLGVAATIVGKISCPHCRRDVADWADVCFRDVIEQALNDPSDPPAAHHSLH
jgi:hypothetical protein